MQRFYLVGEDKAKEHWRVLKIDRSEPSELVITEDPVLYTERGCKLLLQKLAEGNKHSGGLQLVTKAYGIIGFVKFLEPYYMILVTKRRRIGTICGHAIYGVEDTQLITVPHSYKKLLMGMDLTKDFYFSYTYRIMQTLQRNITSAHDDADAAAFIPYESMFVWNAYLTRGVRKALGKSARWTVALVHGSFQQVRNAADERPPARVLARKRREGGGERGLQKLRAKLSIFGRVVIITLIARRSRHFAGTRYLKRGVNDKGRVANDVETEQIVLDEDANAGGGGALGQMTSVVQMRGSIPLFWSQEASRLSPKPDILCETLQPPASATYEEDGYPWSSGRLPPASLPEADPLRYDPMYTATKLHFDDLEARYGMLNAFRSRENPLAGDGVPGPAKTFEKRPREMILRREFAMAAQYLNQILPEDSRLKFIHWDFHKFAKSYGPLTMQVRYIRDCCLALPGLHMEDKQWASGSSSSSSCIPRAHPRQPPHASSCSYLSTHAAQTPDLTVQSRAFVWAGGSKSANVLAVLGNVARECLELTGLYYSGKPPVPKHPKAAAGMTHVRHGSSAGYSPTSHSCREASPPPCCACLQRCAGAASLASAAVPLSGMRGSMARLRADSRQLVFLERESMLAMPSPSRDFLAPSSSLDFGRSSPIKDLAPPASAAPWGELELSARELEREQAAEFRSASGHHEFALDKLPSASQPAADRSAGSRQNEEVALSLRPASHTHTCTRTHQQQRQGGEEEEEEEAGRRAPRLQCGVVRTNCIDCLDRTNVAQYAYGLEALAHQLHALGFMDQPKLHPDKSVAAALMDLYQTMGDVLALQYGGSAAHNTVFPDRQGKWKATTQSREFLKSIRRYYSNAYTDAEKQDAINLFLGHFQPKLGRPALWELDSDYYLHVTGSGSPDFSPRLDPRQDTGRASAEPVVKSHLAAIACPGLAAMRGGSRLKLTSFEKLTNSTCGALKSVRIYDELEGKPRIGTPANATRTAPDAAEVQMQSPNWLFGQRKVEEPAGTAAASDSMPDTPHTSKLRTLHSMPRAATAAPAALSDEELYERFLSRASAESDRWYGTSLLPGTNEDSEANLSYSVWCQGPSIDAIDVNLESVDSIDQVMDFMQVGSDDATILAMEAAMSEVDEVAKDFSIMM
eukprot:jgi/Mesen1/6390/ME000329S05561